MARIRTFKPSFFTSESVADLSFRARLTWLGLWTHCDDEGRCKDNEKLIKAAVWPLDDVSVDDVIDDLAELEDKGRITRYVVEGKTFIQVTNWYEHQRISRPTPSLLPPPNEDSRIPHGGCAEDSAPEGKGREGNREGEAQAPPPVGVLPERCPRCSKMNLLPDDPGPPCHACARLRRDREAAEQNGDRERRSAEGHRARLLIDLCSHCDAEGWFLAEDGAPVEPAVRCGHLELARSS